jgi:hypothetical protein
MIRFHYAFEFRLKYTLGIIVLVTVVLAGVVRLSTVEIRVNNDSHVDVFVSQAGDASGKRRFRFQIESFPRFYSRQISIDDRFLTECGARTSCSCLFARRVAS